MLDVILKRFEAPDETRFFNKGKFEIVRIGGMTIGRASYEPGWKWSEHVSPIAGTEFCEVEHVLMVLSRTRDDQECGPLRQLKRWDGSFHARIQRRVGAEENSHQLHCARCS